MKQLDILEIISQIGGQIVQGGTFCITNVTTNLKKSGIYAIKNNTLFFDVHSRIADLNQYRDYKSCAVVTREPEAFKQLGENWAIIRVPSATEAYWQFINYYRNLFQVPVIGVTGTCGKSTVKEMIKYVLSKYYRVQATKLSQNSLYLNKRYLFGINDRTQAAVFEMGLEGPGDIANSCRYFQPNVGIITTIGVDHLKGCRTLDGYIQAKAELVAGMSPKGTLILNADDKNIKKIDLTSFPGKVIYFGCSDKADFKASELAFEKKGMKFKVNHHEKEYDFYVPGYGEHNVYNALAALAAVCTLGIDIQEAGESLQFYQHIEKHLELHEGINGSLVIDDTWNFNPTSFDAALKVLVNISENKKTLLILGQLIDFEEITREKHFEIGKKIALQGITNLITVGAGAAEIGEGAAKYGMPCDDIYCCTTAEEALEVVSRISDSDTVLLVKKSMKESFGDLLESLKRVEDNA